MNDITLLPSRLPIAPAIAREYDLTPASWRVLVESIFPSAKTIEAVLMALAYCKQRNLDIYKRPVHIVPMWDSKKRDFVETVWEGIASIRTTAARTGAYAGIDAVEYGPTIKREFRGEKDVWERGQKTGTETITRTVEYPEWASVVVYRMVGHERCAYHAKVYWREAYGTQGKMEVPNEMWAKRPYGQLDKCCEAAALRKAFPEELGNTYTVDEMEGRTIEGSVVEEQPQAKLVPPKPPAKTIEPAKEEPKKEDPKPKAKPKPMAKAKPIEPEPELEQEEVGGTIFDDDSQGDDGPTAGDLLSALDAALEGAGTEADVEEIWNDHDLEARLESVPQGQEFQSVAAGIRRKHLKRVG
jgi:phage recombination protein Bet